MSYSSNVKSIDAIIWTFTSVATVLTIARLYTRTCVLKAFGLDDALILASQVFALGLAAFATWHIHHLLLNFQKFVAADDLSIYVEYDFDGAMNALIMAEFVSELLHYITLPIIKCSILAFYRRIVPSRKQHMILYIFAFLMITQSLIFLMLVLFSYDPPSAWFSFTTTVSTHRYRTDYIQVAFAGCHVLYDIIILLLPMPVLVKTKFNKRTRAGLFILFMISFVSLAATVTRLTKVVEYAAETIFTAIEVRAQYVYWSVIEIMTVIMCANLPASPSFYRFISQKIETISQSRKSQESGSEEGDKSDVCDKKMLGVNGSTKHVQEITAEEAELNQLPYMNRYNERFEV